MDPTQIEQVIVNLVVNARDAMPDGGRLIIETANVILDEDFCRANMETTPGEYVLLQVSDTGLGMDRETQQHIFEPFYTTKGIGKGTGLGLAIAYGIIVKHSGHIECESTEGTGT
ncbi:MAG: hybrid sensor histidine kinase/response regulator, partial [Desulfobacteraceae bacterium]|nr:hybrid sensor histidine kinase/response regulator [Desulfobacteraceae bacterium]